MAFWPRPNGCRAIGPAAIRPHPCRDGPEHERRAEVAQKIAGLLPGGGPASAPGRFPALPPRASLAGGLGPPLLGRLAPENDLATVIHAQPLAHDLPGQAALRALLGNQAPVEQRERLAGQLVEAGTNGSCGLRSASGSAPFGAPCGHLSPAIPGLRLRVAGCGLRVASGQRRSSFHAPSTL